MSNNFYVGQEVVCVDDYQDRFCDYQDRFCIGHDPTWKDLKNGVVIPFVRLELMRILGFKNSI